MSDAGGGFVVSARRVPDLEAGDNLSRAEFERRYEAMPHLKKAELIDRVVYMPSPARERAHASPRFELNGWLYVYLAATEGLRGGYRGTVRLDLDNEPQPDVYVRILEEYGGQSRLVDDYVEGAPELVAEVASTSAGYELHAKLRAYQRKGVRDYIVWRVLDEDTS
jgi:Uma2 family endonuclease